MQLDLNIIRVIDIVDGTIVDGPGLRTSIYLAGCKHECPGCHNPQSWDFKAGHDMTLDQIMDHIIDSDMDVTLSGGDPLYQAPQVARLCRMIHEAGKTVWIYSGFTFDQIINHPTMRQVLDHADVLVDGPFIQALRDISLRFRGSSNQRIIDLSKSVPDHIVLWQ